MLSFCLSACLSVCLCVCVCVCVCARVCVSAFQRVRCDSDVLTFPKWALLPSSCPSHCCSSSNHQAPLLCASLAAAASLVRTCCLKLHEAECYRHNSQHFDPYDVTWLIRYWASRWNVSELETTGKAVYEFSYSYFICDIYCDFWLCLLSFGGCCELPAVILCRRCDVKLSSSSSVDADVICLLLLSAFLHQCKIFAKLYFNPLHLICIFFIECETYQKLLDKCFSDHRQT